MDCAERLPCLPTKAKAILAAARVCFERHGFHGASMAAIAAEAGISVGHIYRYFAGKDAVIASLVEQDLQEITADIQTLSGSPEEIASAMLQHIEQLHTRMRTALWLEVMAEGARNPVIESLIHNAELRVQASLRRAVAAAQGAGRRPALTAADVEERLSLISVLLNGLQVSAFVEGKRPSPRLTARVKSLLTEALSDGLGG